MDPIQQLVHQVSTMVAHEEEQGQMKHVSFGRCCKCIKYKIYCVQNGGASIYHIQIAQEFFLDESLKTGLIAPPKIYYTDKTHSLKRHTLIHHIFW